MVCSATPLSVAHDVMMPSRLPDTSPGLGPLARQVTPPEPALACAPACTDVSLVDPALLGVYG